MRPAGGRLAGAGLAPNRRELFFTYGGGPAPRVVMAVSVQPGPSFVASTPTAVVKFPNGAALSYDIAPDGRFLFNVPASATAGEESRPQLIVVQHWFDELLARVPIK